MHYFPLLDISILYIKIKVNTFFTIFKTFLKTLINKGFTKKKSIYFYIL
nr:MAG TPA_asm: hypothetical protein [Bacteriophage sp.]